MPKTREKILGLKSEKKKDSGEYIISPAMGKGVDAILIFFHLFMLIATQSLLFILFLGMMLFRQQVRVLDVSNRYDMPIKEFTVKRDGLGQILGMIVIASAINYTTDITQAIFIPSNLFTAGATVFSSISESFSVALGALEPVLAAPMIIALAITENQVWSGTIPFMSSDEDKQRGLILLSGLGGSVFHLATYTQQLPTEPNFNFFLAFMFFMGFSLLTKELDSTAPAGLAHSALNLNSQTIQLIRTMVS